jgi:uncharacterized membrane protein
MSIHTKSRGIPNIAQFLVAAIGALLLGALYIALPAQLTIGPNWLLLVLEAILLAPPLIWHFLVRHPLPYRVSRGLAVGLLIVVTMALVGSLALLINNLSTMSKGSILLRSAALLWSINVLVFALWYWEVDGGGPLRRHEIGHIATDFQFPQQINNNPGSWAPGFVDYLFLAFCSATALSPADTMPLTHRAKLLMMTEALISLLVLVLLVGRSVNII